MAGWMPEAEGARKGACMSQEGGKRLRSSGPADPLPAARGSLPRSTQGNWVPDPSVQGTALPLWRRVS